MKPFIAWLLISVVLLFVQAMCDLRLPDYMSNIVSIGVQQNGIENAAPDAVSGASLQSMELFMGSDQLKAVEDNYQLVSGTDTNANGKTYASVYPESKTEQIYALKTSADMDAVNSAFGYASWTLINIIKQLQDAKIIPATGNSSDSSQASLTAAQVQQLAGKMTQLPQKDQMIAAAQKTADQADPSMIKQVGIMFTKSFYEELGADTNAIQQHYVINIGIYMLLVSLLGGASTILVSFLSARIAAGTARNIRRSLFHKVETFANAEFDKFSTASLITRTTNDITQIQMLIAMGIRMICYPPIIMVGGSIMAVSHSVNMSWIIVLGGVMMIGLMAVAFSVALPRFKKMQKFMDKLNLVVREHLSGLMVIRAFGTRQYEEDRFAAANGDVNSVTLFLNRLMSILMPIMMLIMNGLTLLIVWVGAHEISASRMQVGDMMAFMQYTLLIIMSFFFLAMMFMIAPRAAVSAGRIREVLETDVSIKDPEDPKAFDPDKKGLIEFKNVGFRYPGAEEDAIQNVSFTAKPGETTAIIGSTGSGKTTIANLLLRFYDVTEGQILVDGADVREVTQHDLRQRIGYVPQRGVLFSGTVASNIKYGNPDATDEEMKQSAAVAQATDFIEEKPDGYESEISQSGTNVSGGQKQRLSIARALAKEPEIFIFDDSFSALDFKTDAALRKALKEQTGAHTNLIIAQRVSTIMYAEQILVLDEGKLMGIGTHKELLATCPEYYEIASSQLTKEEL